MMIQAQIYIDRDDMIGSSSLYNYILSYLIEHKISGATAFKGISGFGSHFQLKKHGNLFSFDEPPILITFIDEEEKVEKVLTELRRNFSKGLIITVPVKIWK